MFYLCYGGPPSTSGSLNQGTATAQQSRPSTFIAADQPFAWANPNLPDQAYSLQNYPTAVDSGRQLNLNGSLCMEVMQFDTVDREFVMSGDGCQYHYTRWTIGASLYVNPERNGFSFFQGGNNLPSILESDITLRNFLRQPRRRLTIIFDTALETTSSANVAYQVLVDVPQSGYSQDHEEGPKPFRWDVKNFAGSSGYVVQFGISFATDDSQNRAFSPTGNANVGFVPLLLSNRWNMRHATDENGYLVRTVQGTAVANMPEIRRRNLMIDQLASMIFPPVYPGMRRQVERNATSEGSTLEYTIVDRQEPMTYIDDVLDLPSQIQQAVDVSQASNAAFSGVYFEGTNDVNVLRQYMQQVYPLSTSSSPPPYSANQTQSDLWFGNSRRQIASLSVRHTMKLAKEVSEAQALEAVAQASADGLNRIVDHAKEYIAEGQRKRKGRRGFPTLSLIQGVGTNAASSAFAVFKALDSLKPRFYEQVEVVAVCRPEGNMKRAFYLALATAYGLANNTLTGSVNPFDIQVQFDYSEKTIQVQIGYQATDYTTTDRRDSGPRKIMIGPQSYLIGGTMDANVRTNIANAYGTASSTLVGTTALPPQYGAMSQSFQQRFQTIFPADANAKFILTLLASNDLPDTGKLIMMDQSQYGDQFPTFGPNGDQISRTFVECFVPLFTAPLVQIGDYPVMLGRCTYPHNANPTGSLGQSTDLSNFYKRVQGFTGDSQTQMNSQIENVAPVTWVNRPF